jgi:hypothetical protein
MKNGIPDIMKYTSDYILGSDINGKPLAYLGLKQVLSLLGPRDDSDILVKSLPPAMELLDGPTRVPIYLWQDVHALLVKVGLNVCDTVTERFEWPEIRK